MTKQDALNKMEELKAFINQLESVDVFKDSCHKLGISDKLPDVSTFQKRDQEHMLLTHKLFIIIRALNEGWEPNWQDSTEKKWYPYFNLVSGFAFSSTNFGWANSAARAGSRLCFKTEELARYAGTQFIELYKEYIK